MGLRLDKRWIATVIFSAVVFAGYPKIMDLADYPTEVNFEASTNAFFKVHGVVEKGASGFIKVNEDGTHTGETLLDMTSFKTGLDLRDKHLRELLQTDKHPTSALKFSSHGEQFTGTLTLVGITKPISGKYDSTKMELSFAVKLSDYDIKAPSFMGVGVDDTVNIIAEVGL